MCSGGLELLFDKVKRAEVETPAGVATMKDLIKWMRDSLLKERPELFVSGDSVCVPRRRSHACSRRNWLPPPATRPSLSPPRRCRRPGILVLINEADWELEGTLAYKLAEGDTIAFISTLHGG